MNTKTLIDISTSTGDNIQTIILMKLMITIRFILSLSKAILEGQLNKFNLILLIIETRMSLSLVTRKKNQVELLKLLIIFKIFIQDISLFCH